MVPLAETLEFSSDHSTTFKPALEMLDSMYEDVDTDSDTLMRPSI